MKIIICGKNGQLAKAFKGIIKNDDVVFYSHNDFNFLNLSEIEENLSDQNADLIINTMAYTNVELAEDEQEHAPLVVSWVALAAAAAAAATATTLFLRRNG